MKVLAIPGSLRATSSNAALLRAAGELAPAGTELMFYDGLAALPPFSPDLDVEPLPVPVAALRAQVGAVDALAISSPEYAHGMPGSLKNALDWLVSALEPIDKPVLLVSASPGGAAHAHAQLLEVLAHDEHAGDRRRRPRVLARQARCRPARRGAGSDRRAVRRLRAARRDLRYGSLSASRTVSRAARRAGASAASALPTTTKREPAGERARRDHELRAEKAEAAEEAIDRTTVSGTVSTAVASQLDRADQHASPTIRRNIRRSVAPIVFITPISRVRATTPTPTLAASPTQADQRDDRRQRERRARQHEHVVVHRVAQGGER